MAHNSRVTGRPGYALANAVPHGARSSADRSSRHRRWIGEITPVKLLSLLPEVCLDQGNLRAVGWVFDRDHLQTAIL